MPLDTHHKMIRGVQFHRFNYTIVGADCRYAQVISYAADRLMMAGITFGLENVPGCEGEARSGRDADWVRIDDIPTRAMIDRSQEDCFEVLNERPIPPDIQSLRTMADGKDRLVQVKRILQQEFVNRSASRVGRTTGGDARFTIAFGIYIEAASGKQHTLDAGQQPGDAILALMQGNHDGHGSNRLKRG